MTAAVVQWDRSEPERCCAACRDVIRSGGVIAYPTDTLYGLGADPRDQEAVRKLFQIKGRSADQPILLLLPDAAAVATWAAEVSPTAHRLMRQHWPGPLTLVFKARPEVLPDLTAGTGTIGLRVPDRELTRSLLRFLGTALTGTSANRSGGAGLLTVEDVMRELGSGVDLILDGGPAAGAIPSTVIDVSVEPPRLVRRGVLAIV